MKEGFKGVKIIYACFRDGWNSEEIISLRFHIALSFIISSSFLLLSVPLCIMTIMKTRLFKYIENLPPKTENFKEKETDIFDISAKNKDCRFSLEPLQRGGSNKYPQSMFLSKNKKKMYTPVNPIFTI